MIVYIVQNGSMWYLELYYNKMFIKNNGILPLPDGWFYYDTKTNKLRIEYTLADSTDYLYLNKKIMYLKAFV